VKRPGSTSSARGASPADTRPDRVAADRRENGVYTTPMIPPDRFQPHACQEPVLVRLAWRLGWPLVRLSRMARLLPLGKRPGWRRLAGGFSMLIDPRDPLDQAFYLGLHEPHLVRLIADLVRPGDVCIDVGAHKGYMTLHLARAAGEEGRILALEADPRAAGQLRANLQHNRLDNVSVWDCAAAEASGSCQFTLSTQLGWSSRFVNDLARPSASTVISVARRCLDEIVEAAGVQPGRDRLSFIKIDVEGSEPMVIAGARRLLAQFRPVLYVELNTDSLRVAGVHPTQLTRDLDAAGYEVRLIRPRVVGMIGVTYVLTALPCTPADEPPPICEIVAFPKGALRGGGTRLGAAC